MIDKANIKMYTILKFTIAWIEYAAKYVGTIVFPNLPIFVCYEENNNVL